MRVFTVLTVAAALLAGCAEQQSEPTPATAGAPEAPRTAPSEVSQPEPTPPTEATTRPEAETLPQSQVMARVNGKPIYMDELTELLIHDHGLSLAQQLIANELVRQEARKQGVTITEDDVNRQEERMLERAFGEVEGKQQRQRLLRQFLNRRGISENLWRLIVRRQAMLDKLAEQDLEISEDELRKAFGEQYGRKVVVRHIQTPTLEEAQEIIEKLRQGADFAELAEAESTNPSADEGGLLPAIGKDTENVPPAIRSTALAMEEVGELSEPVQSGTAFHVLKLEREVPPEDVEFDDVRDELETELRERARSQAGQQLFHQMMLEARQDDTIEFVNPILKQQIEEARQEAEREYQ
ncbi:MAG: peptidylprolyl isomerase [Planctomycetota bacterium]